MKELTDLIKIAQDLQEKLSHFTCENGRNAKRLMFGVIGNIKMIKK